MAPENTDPIETTETIKEKATKPILGGGRGLIKLSDDWDSPETNAEIEKLFYGE